MPHDPSRGVDLLFRPKSYFLPQSLKTRVLSSIKGADRKAIVAKMFEDGRESEIPPELLQSALSDEQRRAVGAIHPRLMGGEYLPDVEQGEVEIARITIESVTQDVACVYASQSGSRFRFRVVDEYDGDTLTGITEMVSNAPLTLGELSRFVLEAWDFFGVLDMNFEHEGYPPERVLGFFRASSEFYPTFPQLVRQRVDEFLEERKNG